MSERGVIVVDRGLFGHPRFADEPFTQREAWLWMIGQAAFRAHCRRVAGIRVELARGEFAHSHRFMADRWQWSRSSVGRFLDMLGTDLADDDRAMIGTRSETGITVVSIRNYDDYQNMLFALGTADGTAPGQVRVKEESIAEGLEEGGVVPAPADSNPDLQDADLDMARAVLRARGEDTESPSVITIAYQAAMWRSRGYDRAEVLATIAEIAAKPEKYPLSYFLAAVVGRLDRRKVSRAKPPNPAQQPLPLAPVLISQTERNHGRTAVHQPGTTWQGARDNFRSARAEFKAGLEAAQSTSDQGGGDSGQIVRLAAPSGRG